MKLYCMRHGEAQSIGQQTEQCLTPKGQADIQKMVDYFLSQHLEIAHIFHSPRLRAQQTAQYFAKTLSVFDVVETDLLVSESLELDSLIEMIQGWEQDTLLVSHLPLVHQLVNTLVLGEDAYHPIINYPPGTVICLECYGRDHFVIDFVLSPDHLPNL
jgi:phosphohistidine phosphatase